MMSQKRVFLGLMVCLASATSMLEAATVGGNPLEQAMSKFDAVMQQGQLDQHALETVNELTTATLSKEKGPDGAGNAQALFEFGKGRTFQFYETVNRVQTLLKSLKQLAQGDADISSVEEVQGYYKFADENEPKVKRMVDQYAIEPCRAHNAQLRDVFEPLEAARYSQENWQRVDFYQAWARFGYCEWLMSYDF